MNAASTNIFRAMAAVGGRPICEDSFRGLGARVPADIKPDAHGDVHPSAGGMSVTPDDPRGLPVALRPQNLGGLGINPVFRLATMELGASLSFRRDPTKPGKHGFVEPRSTMSLPNYRGALRETAPRWMIVL